MDIQLILELEKKFCKISSSLSKIPLMEVF